eukprot:4433827-Prymnesium_polylepis.1
MPTPLAVEAPPGMPPSHTTPQRAVPPAHGTRGGVNAGVGGTLSSKEGSERVAAAASASAALPSAALPTAALPSAAPGVTTKVDNTGATPNAAKATGAQEQQPQRGRLGQLVASCARAAAEA